MEKNDKGVMWYSKEQQKHANYKTGNMTPY